MKAIITIPVIYEVQSTSEATITYADIEYITLGTILQYEGNGYKKRLALYDYNKIIYLHKDELTNDYRIGFDSEIDSTKIKLRKYFKYTGNAYTVNLLLKKINLKPGHTIEISTKNFSVVNK